MNSVDYTLSKIEQALQDEHMRSFMHQSQNLKIVHRCLDGLGVNYTESEPTKLKLYCKVLDRFPKFSDNFSKTFLLSDEERALFYEFCLNASDCIMDRSTGLAGINLAIKKNFITGKVTRSVYIKKSPKKSVVLSFTEDGYFYENYHYVFNRLSVWSLSKAFGIPAHNQALEISLKDKSAFATVYPMFSFSKILKPSKMSQPFEDLFFELQGKNPWEIENYIFSLIYGRNNYLTPITKGYKISKKERKMYFGAFSYKHSSFKSFLK